MKSKNFLNFFTILCVLVSTTPVIAQQYGLLPLHRASSSVDADIRDVYEQFETYLITSWRVQSSSTAQQIKRLNSIQPLDCNNSSIDRQLGTIAQRHGLQAVICGVLQPISGGSGLALSLKVFLPAGGCAKSFSDRLDKTKLMKINIHYKWQSALHGEIVDLLKNSANSSICQNNPGSQPLPSSQTQQTPVDVLSLLGAEELPSRGNPLSSSSQPSLPISPNISSPPPVAQSGIVSKLQNFYMLALKMNVKLALPDTPKSEHLQAMKMAAAKHSMDVHSFQKKLIFSNRRAVVIHDTPCETLTLLSGSPPISQINNQVGILIHTSYLRSMSCPSNLTSLGQMKLYDYPTASLKLQQISPHSGSKAFQMPSIKNLLLMLTHAAELNIVFPASFSPNMQRFWSSETTNNGLRWVVGINSQGLPYLNAIPENEQALLLPVIIP